MKALLSPSHDQINYSALIIDVIHLVLKLSIKHAHQPERESELENQQIHCQDTTTRGPTRMFTINSLDFTRVRALFAWEMHENKLINSCLFACCLCLRWCSRVRVDLFFALASTLVPLNQFAICNNNIDFF